MKTPGKNFNLNCDLDEKLTLIFVSATRISFKFNILIYYYVEIGEYCDYLSLLFCRIYSNFEGEGL